MERKPIDYKDILSMFLPKGMLDYFDFTDLIASFSRIVIPNRLSNLLPKLRTTSEACSVKQNCYYNKSKLKKSREN